MITIEFLRKSASGCTNCCLDFIMRTAVKALIELRVRTHTHTEILLRVVETLLLITNTIKQSPDVHSLLCLSPVTRYVAKTIGDAGWSIAIVISITLPAHALYHDT